MLTIDSRDNILREVLDTVEQLYCSKGEKPIEFIEVYNKTYLLAQRMEIDSLLNGLLKIAETQVVECFLPAIEDSQSDSHFLELISSNYSAFQKATEIVGETCSYIERVKLEELQGEGELTRKLLKIFISNLLSDSGKSKVKEAICRELTSFLKGNTESTEFLTVITLLRELEKLKLSTFHSSTLEEALSKTVEDYFCTEERPFCLTSLVEILDYLDKSLQRQKRLIASFSQKVVETSKSCFDSHVNTLSLFREEFEEDINRLLFDSADTRLYGIFDSSDSLQEVFISEYEKALKKRVSREITKIKENSKFDFLHLFDYLLLLLKKLNKNSAVSFSKQNRILNSNKRVLERIVNEEEYFPADFARMTDKKIREAMKSKKFGALTDFAKSDFKNIYKLLQEKDVFEAEFKQLTEERLLKNCFYIREAESPFYEEMEKISGIENNSRLMKLYLDIRTSFAVHRQFTEEKPNLLVFVKLLQKDNWSCNSKENLNIPTILDETVTKFTNFYYSRFQHRSLQWKHDLSWAEVEVRLEKTIPFVLVLNAVQLNLLFMFNKKAKISVKEAFQASGMDELAQLSFRTKIAPLVETGLLECQGEVENEQTVLKLNKEFKTEKPLLNMVNMVKKKAVAKKSSRDEAEGSIERRARIDSMIIKVVKRDKKILLGDLTDAVAQQVRRFCVPKEEEISNRVDNLVDRKLVKREDDMVFY